MAVDIYLVLDKIKGETQDDVMSKENAIDVLAWNWGMSQSGTTHLGKGGGGGKVAVQDISLTKFVDAASADLIKLCCNGQHIATGHLLVRKAGGDKPVDYLKLEMKEILISSYSTGGSSDGLDRVTENLTLNFATFKISYTEQDESGAAGTVYPAMWSMSKNKADFVV